MYNPNVPMRKRITSAIWALIINAIFWIVIPYYLGMFLAGKVPETPLAIPTFVYEFGVLFIILDVGAAFFQGKAIAVPFISGAALLSAVYIWLVTNGGVLSITTSGIHVGLGFTLLLYVLIIPSIWAAIRTPISYLVWRRAVLSQPANPVPA
jgi:hypothetical protein